MNRAADGHLTITHVVTSTHRRGAESFAVDLAAALDRSGLTDRVVALQPARDGASFDIPVLSTRGSLVTASIALRQLARESDVVVAHGSRTLLASYLATRGTGVPYIYRLIGDPTYWTRSVLQRARVAHMLSTASAVATYYDAAADVLLERYGLDPGRVHVIPKGIDVSRFPVVTPAERATARRNYGIGDDDPVVVFIGALSTEKNPALAIDAVLAGPDLTLLLVGSGPLRSDLEVQASVAGDRIRLLGSLEDPRPALAAADALVLPSVSEGVPGVALEASLCGLPVVATDVGGSREVVVDGQTGYLIPPGDVDATHSAVVRAVELASGLGRAGRQHSLSFDIERVAAQWRGLLSTLATERDRGARETRGDGRRQ